MYSKYNQKSNIFRTKANQISYDRNYIMSELIKRLINNQLNKNMPKINSREWALELAKKAETMKIKGLRNLSKNSDKYLYK